MKYLILILLITSCTESVDSTNKKKVCLYEGMTKVCCKTWNLSSESLQDCDHNFKQIYQPKNWFEE